MGMRQATQRWTEEGAGALPADGNRYEVVAGELFVTPAPNFDHQAAVLSVAMRLAPYVAAHRLGYALASPPDIEFDEEDPVQPDVFVTPPIAGRPPRQWSEIKMLLLAVEAVSPSTARADRTVTTRPV